MIFCCGFVQAKPSGDLYILCYHDIPKEVKDDKYGVDQRTFVNTIEYFKSHGFSFVSLDDVIKANQGEKDIPDKSILLTFDDGYVSFYDFVYPILESYNIPSVLAVVTEWVDGNKPKTLEHEIMTWNQIKEVSESPLIEVVSHSHDLHKGIVYNPQGNTAAISVHYSYDSVKQIYESKEEYQERIRQDIEQSKTLLESKTGQKVRAVAWPYGKYNLITQQEALDQGYLINFGLSDHVANVNNIDLLDRFLVYENPSVLEFIKDMGFVKEKRVQKRMIQVDLDWIYDEDPEQTEINLGQFLDRIKAMKVTTVILQAFADPKGTGNIESVYFPNQILPMRADLFSRVTHQLKTRAEVEVYAWMPMLSIVLPDKKKNDALRVHEYREGKLQLSTSWYNRLSLFDHRTQELMKSLYEDLAKHSSIDGIIFQDDGYLNDFEDFHPEAMEAFEKSIDIQSSNPDHWSSKQIDEWSHFKIKALNEFSEDLMSVVRIYRPEAKFGRTLYAPVVYNKLSEKWFGQSYAQSLEVYDYVVIMAYPNMEKVRNKKKWLHDLVNTVKQHDGAIKKTIFKVQTYDWDAKNGLIPKRLIYGYAS